MRVVPADGGGQVEQHVPPESSESRTDRLRRHWAIKSATILIPVLVGAIASVWAANKGSREETQVVKDKAEQGYQDIDKLADEQKAFNSAVAEQLQDIKLELAELRRRSLRPAPRTVPRRAAVVGISPPPPLPKVELAPDLDKVLEQAQQAKPPPVPAPTPTPPVVPPKP